MLSGVDSLTSAIAMVGGHLGALRIFQIDAVLTGVASKKAPMPTLGGTSADAWVARKRGHVVGRCARNVALRLACLRSMMMLPRKIDSALTGVAGQKCPKCLAC